jgi:hypothetical protein
MRIAKSVTLTEFCTFKNSVNVTDFANSQFPI